MQSAFSISTEAVLTHLLLQFALICAAARLVGRLFVKLGQSQSIGEIFAGVMLGPSLAGLLLPGAFDWIFPSRGPTLLPYFSHIGLVLALFLIGMEFDFREVPRHFTKVAGVAIATLIVPLIAGLLIAYPLWNIAPGRSFPPFALFLGLTFAITAIPIMGRILVEQELVSSRVGVLGITTGAVKDLLMWFLLAVVIGIAKPPLDVWLVVRMVVLTALLATFMLTVGRKTLAWADERWGNLHGKPHPSFIASLLISLFLLAAATSAIGIFAIFGAFIAGVVLSSRRRLAATVSSRLHDLTVLCFLPIFFTYTGLRCDISSLTPSLLGWMLIVTIIGTLASGAVGMGVARLGGLQNRESVAMGALINTPGLMVLIVLNIGLDLEVIPKHLFAVLVGSALLRNLMVTPILRWAKQRGLPRLDETSVEVVAEPTG